MGRRIYIGDVHGMLRELEELVNLLRPTSDDSLVFLGDLIDRGPEPVETVRFVRALNATVVLGNHEEKALRFLRHEDRVASEPGYRNPMTSVPPSRVSEWRALSADDRAFLQEAVHLAVHEDWVAVHGGLLPGLPLDRQTVNTLIRTRWVDAAGRYVAMTRGSVAMPAGARPWMEAFDGDFNVVVGHAVHSLEEPLVTYTANDREVWSIDTGAVFGGRLTALIFDGSEARPMILQVQAHRAYADLRTGEVE